jgi:hypothetical protein
MHCKQEELAAEERGKIFWAEPGLEAGRYACPVHIVVNLAFAPVARQKRTGSKITVKHIRGTRRQRVWGARRQREHGARCRQQGAGSEGS